jgi:hypothetical protein
MNKKQEKIKIFKRIMVFDGWVKRIKNLLKKKSTENCFFHYPFGEGVQGDHF